MAAALLAKVLPFDLFETRRLLGAAVGIAGLAVTWRIGRRIGGPLAGLVALVLLAACPLYYGHMFINAKDAPFAVAMALFLLGLVRLLEQYPRPCADHALHRRLRASASSIGSRIMAGFGVLEALAALALLFAIEARHDGVRRGGPPARPCRCSLLHPERRPRLCGDGADLAVGAWSIRSIRSGHRNLLAFLREALAASCSTAR